MYTEVSLSTSMHFAWRPYVSVLARILIKFNRRTIGGLECFFLVLKNMHFKGYRQAPSACSDKELWRVNPVSQWFGYPRVLGTPVPKSLLFWVPPVGIPKTLKALNTADWGKWNHPEFCSKNIYILTKLCLNKWKLSKTRNAAEKSAIYIRLSDPSLQL